MRAALFVFFATLLVACASPSTPVKQDASVFGAQGNYALPTGPALVNGLDAGTWQTPPGIVLPQCEAGTVWANGGPGTDGGCVVAGGGGSSPTTSTDIVWDASSGTVVNAQDAAVQFNPNGSTAGMISSGNGTAYVIGSDQTGSNETALCLGYANSSGNPRTCTVGGYNLKWDGTNLWLNSSSGTNIQLGSSGQNGGG